MQVRFNLTFMFPAAYNYEYPRRCALSKLSKIRKQGDWMIKDSFFLSFNLFSKKETNKEILIFVANHCIKKPPFLSPAQIDLRKYRFKERIFTFTPTIIS